MRFGEAVSVAKKVGEGALETGMVSDDSAEPHPDLHKLPLPLQSWGAGRKVQAPGRTFWLGLRLVLGTQTLGREQNMNPEDSEGLLVANSGEKNAEPSSHFCTRVSHTNCTEGKCLPALCFCRFSQPL